MRFCIAYFAVIHGLTNMCLAQRDVLFQNATIATWNDTSQAMEVHRGASSLVHEDVISRIYKSSQRIDAGEAEVIAASDKIIVTGFVSTHQHVWQTLYRTLIPNLPFAAYFPRLGHMVPISETLTSDDVYRSELMGALELMSEGTTLWVDITGVLSPETVESAWKATFASGGRSFFAATLQPKATFPEDAQLSQIESLAARPELHNKSLITLGLSYDVFEASNSSSRTKVLDLVHSRLVQFITTHYVGGPFGNNNRTELLSRPEWSLLNESPPIVFSHSSQITPLDASLLRNTNQYVSIAPESEKNFGQGNPIPISFRIKPA